MKQGSNPPRRAGRRATIIALFALAVLGSLTLQSSVADAGSKSLSGELHCASWQRVSGVWMLGSQSGWHGGNFGYSGGVDTRKPSGKYSAKFVEGETVKVWLRCSLPGSKAYTEYYSSFKVGRGNTRHICSPNSGWWCTSGQVGGCALFAVLSSNPISLWKCAWRA